MWRVSSLSLSLPFSLPISLFAQGAVIGIDDEDDSTFTITVDQKTFHFQGKTFPPPHPFSFCTLILTPVHPQPVSFLCAFQPLCIHPCCSFAPSHSLPLSPPLKDLDWSAVIPGNTCTQAFTQFESVRRASELFASPSSGKLDWFTLSGHEKELWIICSTASWADTIRTEGVSLSPHHSVFSTVAEEQDRCLCVSAVEPLGIIREYCWARGWAQVSAACCCWLSSAAAVVFCLTTRHLTGTGLTHSQQSSPSTCPANHSFFFGRKLSSTPQTSFFILSARSLTYRHHLFSPLHLSFHLCICIHLVLPHFVNTEPTHTSPPPPPPCLISLLRVTSHSSMGLQLPSPSSCPLPCLCFEAVCCGSTNGRVRRKRCTSLGMHARQPWAEEARGVVDCLSLRSQ